MQIGPGNGGVTRADYSKKKLDDKIIEFKLSVEHFSKSGQPKSILLKKICPVCSTTFFTKQSRDEKTTCSRSCSNTFFAERRNRPENHKSYRTICFKHHIKKCVCCDEIKIVEVHHFDGNKKNNSLNNLIPICPTHHKYFHSKFRSEVEDKINLYKENFDKNLNSSCGTNTYTCGVLSNVSNT